MRPADTSESAHRVHVDALRRLTLEERADAAIELSHLVFELAADGIQRRNPDLDENGRQYELIRLLHGRNLADAVFHRM
jgi:hypothetical protein